MSSTKTREHGFTFIELMLVIVILGVLASLLTGNFITSLKKGRDARRKTDLENIQKAIELFYEDKREYPTFSLPFGDQLCETNPSNGSRVYMQKVPSDPTAGNSYLYESDGTYYRIYSCLENDQDAAAGVNQSGYTGTSCGTCGVCKYKVTSSNTQ